MKLPYHLLQVAGEVILAAQGANIISFNAEGSHLSTWTHPTQASQTADEPPSKRRKVETVQEGSQDDDANAVDGQPTGGPGQPGKKRKRGKKGEGQKQDGEGSPIIQVLIATPDGSHIVALTGADKTIWVFQHDGAGHLNLLSSRVMPKRPSSIDLTTDNQNILSADKFGDVYSLPLVPSEASPTKPSEDTDGQGAQSSSGGLATPVSRTTFKPEANESTVHTQRNLRALKEQIRYRERVEREREQKAAKGQSLEPQFEHTLLLGHVSMLTAVLSATHGGRPYILTADRDEHIRVSRGIPQAYVIEGYCLGHEQFISKLCIPGSRPEILISGGGDNCLFVFDWKKGKLLSRFDILEKAKSIAPAADKVAVSGLFSWRKKESERQDSCIAVLIEHIPALFILNLTDSGNLEHVQSVVLPGKPLSAVQLQSNSFSGLLVAIDPSNPASADGARAASPSLRMLEANATDGWRLSEKAFTNEDVDSGDGGFSLDALLKVLYSIESLRKQDHDDAHSTAGAASASSEVGDEEPQED
ncbi:hypothetical protein GQ53DRAFT_806917 [Thozetella sp. PMI_491]|nr:hypothetical protein GQ53DRAFT_806917 [Thozetella sp. PMI_491]